jgi:hypothetical protein
MAFVKINGGDQGGQINSWKTIGQEAEGSFGGFKPGKFGPQSLVEIGNRTFTAGAVLKRHLRDVAFGAKVKVVYLGKLRGATGTEYGNFDVFVDTEQQTQPGGNGAGVGPTLSDDQRFDLLYAKIQKEKGPMIASALLGLSGNKLDALRDAAAQVGVTDTTETVPF